MREHDAVPLGSELECGAGELSPLFGVERADSHGVEHGRLAEERREQRYGDIAWETAGRGRQRARGRHRPVVLEEATSAEHHQVGATNRLHQCAQVVEREGRYAVPRSGVLGISGGDQQMHVRSPGANSTAVTRAR